jgi:hypothetical protein
MDQSGLKIREASCFTITAPTLFARRKHLRLLVLWNVEGSLQNREFNSSDEIEEVITKVWDELAFNQVQRVFHNWMDPLPWAVENGGEDIIQ